MRFDRLLIRGWRSISDAHIELARGLNVFHGTNGAGKTSILEAAYALSHGRSFRHGSRDGLIQRGCAGLTVFGRVELQMPTRQHDVGLALERRSRNWQARLDGSTPQRLSDLVQACAVVCFEPDSSALIIGPAELRRRFLDWGVFHVEHAFIDAWRRYQRALKQRNVLLKRADGGANDDVYDPWESEMSLAAAQMQQWRASYVNRWNAILQQVCARLTPELSGPHVSLTAGWPDDELLQHVLRRQRDRDRFRGHTGAGPHRADWHLTFDAIPDRDVFSRGQAKMAALCAHMAQAELYAEDHGEWPIVCLDDIDSELDDCHRSRVLDYVRTLDAQILVTSLRSDALWRADESRLFHVEHGDVKSH